jgi:clan AA aspartic protease (TIGR02281 family)
VWSGGNNSVRILLGIISIVVGTVAGGLAMLALLGAGVMRQGPLWLVAVMALALVILPARGLATPMFKAKRPSTVESGMSMLVWSMVLLITFPLYFPDEREDALSLGLAALEPYAQGYITPDWAADIDDWLPAVDGARAVPPQASALAPVKPPPVKPRPPPAQREATAVPDKQAPAEADQVVLPTEGRMGSLRVPVTIEGPRRQVEVSMVFDTGASITTLNRATLRKIGVRIPDDAPQMTVHTAAGPRNTRVVLVDRLWVGGLQVDGVSISVCDACATGEAVGLLGLNVSERFLVTVDGAREEVSLAPRAGALNRRVDVSPWVDIEAEATRWPDGRTEVVIEAENRSRRWIESLRVAIHCEETRYAQLRDVGPGQIGRVEVSVSRAAGCESFQVSLDEAAW